MKARGPQKRQTPNAQRFRQKSMPKTATDDIRIVETYHHRHNNTIQLHNTVASHHVAWIVSVINTVHVHTVEN